jgi:ribonuclease HI
MADLDSTDVGEEGLDPAVIGKMKNVLKKHQHILVSSSNAMCRPVNGIICDVKLKENFKIIKCKARPIPDKWLKQLYELLRAMLKVGLIEFTASEWAAPIVIVLKKDLKTIRLCIDYKSTNDQFEFASYPVPPIEDVLDTLSGCLWLNSLDMANGYWAVPLSKRAKNYLSFICPLGHFAPTRMMQGLHKAAAVYQMMISASLYGMVPPSPAVTDEELGANLVMVDNSKPILIKPYMDDVNFGEKCPNRLVEVTEDVLSRLELWGISINLKKSKFLKRRIETLSFRAGADGISPAWKDVEKVLGATFPNNRKEMLALIGSILYYRKFIQDFAGLTACLYKLNEEDYKRSDLDVEKRAFMTLQTRVTELSELSLPDPALPYVVLLYSNAMSIGCCLGQPTNGKTKHIKVVSFDARTLTDSEECMSDLEREYLCLIRATQVFWNKLYGQRFTVHSAVENFKWSLNQFIGGRLEKFKIMLSPFMFDVEMIDNNHVGLAAWASASVLNPGQYVEALEEFVPKGMLTVRSQPEVPAIKSHVLCFDGSSSNSNNDGSAAAILFGYPEWEVLWSVGTKLPGATVNEAEASALRMGLLECNRRNINNLVVFGDSELIIHQLIGKKRVLNKILKEIVHECRLIIDEFEECGAYHVPREYNASADYLARLAKDCPDIVLGEPDMLKSLNKLPKYLSEVVGRSSEVKIFRLTKLQQNVDISVERMKRIAAAQDRVEWMYDVKSLLKGGVEIKELTKKRARKAQRNISDYVLNDEGVLYHVGASNGIRKSELLQMVIPSEIKEEIIYSCHDQPQGGHWGFFKTYWKIRRSFYWKGMHRDVFDYCNNCKLCQTGKRSRDNHAPSPGNIEVTHPMHVVSIDLVGKLPEGPNGEKEIMVATDIFTGYVWASALVKSSAPACALALEEEVFLTAGVCEILRHDRDQRFEGELFRTLNRALGVTSRATLAYNPRANGHVELKNKLVIQVLRLYCEDINQRDWPLHLKAVCFAINVSFDAERGDTPFYLFHGWDAKTTMEAMFPTPREVSGNFDAKEWRRRTNVVYYQVRNLVQRHYRERQLLRAAKTEKLVRGKPFNVGDRVWVYAQNVKLENRKLAHMWVGPYRIKEVSPEQPHYYVLDVSGKNDIHPQVHFDRLKLCFDHSLRPKEKLLRPDLPPIDFDERLLPLDSFEPEGYEGVEALIDRRWTRRTRKAKPQVEYKVKWENGGTSWVREYDLHCPSLVKEYIDANGPIDPWE